ncbi:MAG: hypothetical protein LUQ65_08860 [Candidatus Helarchaeota archaeon]|nr:hypothetical protein [Candidatus Helarchaeota archaeon]
MGIKRVIGGIMCMIGGIGLIVVAAIILSASSTGFNLTWSIVGIICGILGIIGGALAFLTIKIGGALAAIAGLAAVLVASAGTVSFVGVDLVATIVTFFIAVALQIFGGFLGYTGSVTGAIVGAVEAAAVGSGGRPRSDDS